MSSSSHALSVSSYIQCFPWVAHERPGVLVTVDWTPRAHSQGTLWSPITLSDDSTLTPYSLPPPYRTPPIFPYPAFNDPTRRNENQIQFPPMGRDVTPWTNLDHQVDFGIDIDPFLRDYVFAAMESNVGQAQHTVTQLCRAAEVLAQMLVNQSTQTPVSTASVSACEC